MDPVPRDGDFYGTVPRFRDFASLTDPALYRPLPDGWLIGMTDVVDSTQAVQAGRYKVVNTAGASVIAALGNALGQPFPYVFGGDGASFAVPQPCEAAARDALASTAAWASEELGLPMRAALVPVRAVREQGLDVRIARFEASPQVSYAMFTGGGLRWAEAAMKRGCFSVPPAGSGSRPDLTGLSCRWEEIPASNGVMLSVVLVPQDTGDRSQIRAFVEELLQEVEASPEVARPLSGEEPRFGWPGRGVELEARMRRRSGGSLAAARAAQFLRSLASFAVFRLGLRVPGFDADRYRGDLVANTDFRKYDDGLRMTLDCTPAFVVALESRLQEARSRGLVHFGLHRQAAAILTCITPSLRDRSHVHFVDGAAGGYALAAARLKESAGLVA